MVGLFAKFNSGRGRSARKAGFGIMEVLVSSVVLGFLYMALLNLQKGNHEALLRIRGRDGATEVAQNIIDSLSSLGLASLSDQALGIDPVTGSMEPMKITAERKWDVQFGLSPDSMKVEYEADVVVSPDADYMAKSSSLLLGEAGAEHVYAKRVDVTVNWWFKGSKQSIKVSGVIR
ncbi:type II secretion system protein [uncultured Fibrobacter sp.]|uniref:type IV pilus modification PilV family protein n=1 Tax=uncultured Fibrobacter sp. TaxID=261512 RepID=UPI0026109B2A|nr:type II secretion system protein [uncultured Fibrobacter sp.]